MIRRKFPVLLTMASVLVALTWGASPADAAKKEKNKVKDKGKIAQAEREAAFKRAAALGLKPGLAGWKSTGQNLKATGRRALVGTEGTVEGYKDPGGVPHYFGPWANWAYSPLPKGPVAVVSVTSPGTGYTNPVVTIDDVYTLPADFTAANVSAIGGNGVIFGFNNLIPGSGYVAPLVNITDATGSGASVTATIDAAGAITGFNISSGGTGYSATPVVSITDDPVFCGALCGSGASASALVGNGGIIGFTIVGGGGGYTAPWVTITDNPALCGGASQPACGTGATADATIGGTLTGGLKKFVDKLPGLTPAGVNNLGQYIPLAVADSAAFPGSDYYEIALVEFYEKMHTDLPPTRHRGYVQIYPPGTVPPASAVQLFYLPVGAAAAVPITFNGNNVFAYDNPHFLGPTIVAAGNLPGATSNTAVRIKFYNLLPVGPADANGRRPGDLFIPVDETVMGSGLGPAGPGAANDKYAQNRATIHLHGNNTVWISDGTPHQWTTPANETTPYPKGVSVFNVPDMPNPGKPPVPPAVDPAAGTMTFYYTNAMSARLMFYHDHAMGITRLNVYAGEAAGYLLTDAVDQDMIGGTNLTGVNIASPPGSPTPFLKVLPDVGIPLVIQDRTWVDATTIFAQDPTWNWGTGPRDPATGKITAGVTGDLWVPHVYMSAQNPGDLSGMNAFGRWHYGPWFTPPTPTCTGPNTPAGCIEVGPVPNEYFGQPGQGAWEPPLRPGVPNPSIAGEAFNDTPIVNGTAYPYMVVEPKAYRFRILNAANDRFLNLQLYVAADKKSPTTAGTPGAVLCDGLTPVAVGDCTEVAMRLVTQSDENQTANTPSGLPNDTLQIKGPNWWQIGTEGGFLAKPVNVPQQPVGWNMNATAFNVGVVNQHSLLLGTAERADVVVDFSAFAGKTLILYNDAPAAFPAGVPTYDYYTGVANQMDVGGAPTTQPGYGPNTRTIMQIQVGTAVTTPTPDVTFPNLQAVFAKTASKRGVFEVSQDPILIPQAAYNSAYANTFPSTAAQWVMLGDTGKTFQPIDKAGALQPAITMPLQMKAMHDEMGGVYDTGFGRMSGMLGLTNPQAGNAFLIPYSYASPPTDIIKGSADVDATPIGSLADGTQIWRIFHNGVDTHTIHTHLFTSQMINRIGQDNAIVDQEPSELGFKDTFRINPLEVTFLAMRPVLPTPAQLPFEVPDSIRLIDPTLPEGASLIEPSPAGWFDPAGNAITEILNHYVNFGWEYVWHCHILAHEEMDMMHSLVAAVPPKAPTSLTGAWDGKNNPSVNLIWNDLSSKEGGYRIERATNSSFTSGLTTFNRPANTTTYTDSSVAQNTAYWYRVIALGTLVGDTFVYPASIGFPTMSANSVPFLATNNPVNVGNPIGGVPASPTLLTATAQAGPRVSLTWRDNATNETGFVVERCTGVGCEATLTNFAQIATPGPRTNTGNVTYLDTTVTGGNTYSYRVKAMNDTVPSAAYTNIVAAAVPAVPAAPTNFIVSVVKANGNKYTATLTWAYGANPTNFTVQRATNFTFTTGLSTSTPGAALRSITQTVNNNTTYYYRIRANDSVSGSSAWTNALPFPIRTGP